MTTIQTTTAGSLPRTDSLIAANAARALAADGFTLESTPEFESLLAAAVDDVVGRQRAAGITQVGDGEFGKAMSSPVDYGAWWSYSFQRVSGLSLTDVNAFTQPPAVSTPGNIVLTSFTDRRDRQAFPAVYADAVETGRTATAFPTTTGPLVYHGRDRARQRGPGVERVLRRRRGAPVGVGGGHARGVPGHRGVGTDPPDRRPVAGGELGPDHP